MHPASTISDKLHELADQLPRNATWSDVRYQVELQASIERGLAQSEAGQTVAHEDILREFGIAE
jgi:predicted transcriptional regulator